MSFKTRQNTSAGFALCVMGVFALSWPVSTLATSFDCAKAQSKVEKMICADAELSGLDDEMAGIYAMVLKVSTDPGQLRNSQKQWLKERNSCVTEDCVEGLYKKRLSKLKAATAHTAASPLESQSSKTIKKEDPIPVSIACSVEEERGSSNPLVQEIVGLYRQSVEGRPAHIGQPEERLIGYNYLAITSVSGNQIRVRLTTKEINGHDCNVDSQALLCERNILLLPNNEEKMALDATRQSNPRMRVTQESIAFVPNPDGTDVSGSPYCGNRGVLNHSFKRSNRKSQIDSSVFNQ